MKIHGFDVYISSQGGVKKHHHHTDKKQKVVADVYKKNGDHVGKIIMTGQAKSSKFDAKKMSVKYKGNTDIIDSAAKKAIKKEMRKAV